MAKNKTAENWQARFDEVTKQSRFQRFTLAAKKAMIGRLLHVAWIDGPDTVGVGFWHNGWLCILNDEAKVVEVDNAYQVWKIGRKVPLK